MDEFLAKIAAHFDLKGQFQSLGGEYDLNFLNHNAQGAVIVKIMRAGCASDFVDMQRAAIAHALKQDPSLPLPEIMGSPIIWPDAQADERIIWLQRALVGRPMGDMAPQAPDFLYKLGQIAGRLNKALVDFDHPQLMRPNKWQLLESTWIETGLDKIKSPHRQGLLKEIIAQYRQVLPLLRSLPQQTIHNDLNDWNILVEQQPNQTPKLSGLIDFGDMCRAPVICDLAIAGAYAIMRQRNIEQALAALVKGFHETCPLSEDEISILWPLVRMRLAVSVVNAAIESEKTPDELYVTISERGAWDLLEDKTLDVARLLARLRHACGLPIAPQAAAIISWLAQNHHQFAPVLLDNVQNYPVADFSVETCLWPENPLAPTPLISLKVAGIEGERAIGRYGEPRLAYHQRFDVDALTLPHRPTVCLGLDIFAPAGSPVHAPLAGIVVGLAQDDDGLDVILRHDTVKGSFFTLWCHLAFGRKQLNIGTQIEAGEAFALGKTKNSLERLSQKWTPVLRKKLRGNKERENFVELSETKNSLAHIFVQMSVVDLAKEAWLYATHVEDQEFCQMLFPNPACLLNLDIEKTSFTAPSHGAVLDYRKQHFSANLKLSYRAPVMFVRGWQHYLFDPWGQPFLDAYNNVPHVGHAHPRIRRVACEQLGRMNSNTRYLHPAQKAFAEKLISKMPKNSGLEVCFFVNSGSEANELALRLARAASGGYDIITADHGYHGNTTGAIDISAYKFNKPGMDGRKDWVHLVDVADGYRGRFRHDNPDCAALYGAQIDEALAAIDRRGGKLAGFICETFPSVGGQIIPPSGYLAQVYQRIRASGGICIADEVQTGLGRLGAFYFAFEVQDVVPDIIVLGKPIGNGHPLAAVVTTRKIAEKFSQGAEYFSTFGGSTLSCLTGKEVLDIVDEEGLAHNADRMGVRLLSGLCQLQNRYEVIGDVRGMGLFIGVDLVEDRESRQPATAVAEHVTNRLREMHILIGREGPADNILKIRPPLTIDATAIDRICEALDDVLHDIS